MIQKLRRGLIVLATVVVLFGVFTATAHADLDSEPQESHGFSASNPGAGEDYWWRQGWGRTLHPDIALAPPAVMDYRFDGYILGMLYSVDRSAPPTMPNMPGNDEAVGDVAMSIIDTNTPEQYYRASFGGTTPNTGPYGTNADNTIDMLGIYANPPMGGWPLPIATAAHPVEGQWFLHYRYFSNLRYSTRVHTIPFGIDTTPPNPVTGLTIKTGLTSPPVTTWQPNTRAYITWAPESPTNRYDELSGVGYYEVLVDDKPLIPETSAGPTPKQGRVYSAPWLPSPSSITVENMPPGKHKISIVCVDRATNHSVATSGYYYSDPDVPSVAFTAPLTGFLKDTTYISADATDSAGAPGVTFALDGSNLATFTAPPYRFKPNLTGVTPGPHVLSATATDKLGRSVTTTLAVSTLGATVIPSDGLIVSDDISLNSGVSTLSETHPNTSIDPELFWRQGWGNSLHPQFEVTPPSSNPAEYGFVAGMLYSMNRTPGSVIDPSKPGDYYKTAKGDATLLDQTVDLSGIYLYPPAGGWPVSTMGGEAKPIEGMWYFNFLPYTTRGYTGTSTYNVPIGIDLTKPHAVTNLKASPSTNPADNGAWTGASRAHITWDADRYDDLSGVGYYQVLIDGIPVVGAPGAPETGRVYEVIGRTPSSITIENMPPGKHKVSVVAVDRATNESLATSTYFYSDPDAPTIALLTPASSIIQVKPSLTASATDLGGVKNVVYRLDGVIVGTAVTAPYASIPDLSAFGAGAHTLSATVTDMVGRTAMVSKSVTLDKTPVKVSGYSRTPALFYPIRRDNYYDNSTIKYTLNKPASVTLTIRDSNGVTRKTLSATRGTAGSYTFVWDGKWASDSKAHTGTFTYQITAKDSAGYTFTTTKLSTTIRNYELVKTGPNTVKVVPR